MASTAFTTFEANVRELKRIYLDASLGATLPTLDQSELARAFSALAHAEIEYFLEKIFEDLSREVMRQAMAGRYISSSLALLTYSNIEQLAAGQKLLNSKAEKRVLAKRLSEAFGKYSGSLSDNHGVREKYLAKLAIPMGLSGDLIDPTWINDLEAFCDRRGAVAHRGRHDADAAPAGFNPTDIWSKCDTLIWGNPALPPGLIASFREIDDWVTNQMAIFGPLTLGPTSAAAFTLWDRIKRFILR